MGGSLFSGGKKEVEEFSKEVNIHAKAIFTLAERQKQIENDYELVNEKLDLLEHNLTEIEKKENKDIKSIREEIKEIKLTLDKLKDFSLKVKKELEVIARKDEVEVLKKYIDLWNPMNFATREEIEKVRDEIIEVIEEFLKKKD